MDPLTEPTHHKRRRRLLRRRRFRIASHSGAEVVSLRQLPPKERLRVTAPSMFTAANMACGFSAVPLAFNGHSHWAAVLMTVAIVMDRSEERRVGKEGRSRWSPD